MLAGEKNRAAFRETKDVSVVAWVDKNVSFPPLENVSNLTIDAFLPGFCVTSVGALSNGRRDFVFSDTDRQWVNAFLISNSSNNPPSDTIDPESFRSRGDYRMFSRAQARLYSINGKIVKAALKAQRLPTIGKTPDPCNSFLIPPAVMNDLQQPEIHVDNGASGVTPSGDSAFMLSEGRLGIEGQKGNFTLNGCTTSSCNLSNFQDFTAWIYALTRLGADLTNSYDHQIFPTYYLYEDGKLVTSSISHQSEVEAFIRLHADSQLRKADIK